MHKQTYAHSMILSMQLLQLAFSRGSDGGQKDMGRVLQERNQLKTKVTELKRENANLQKKLSKSVESLKPDKPSDKAASEPQVRRFIRSNM